MQGGFNAGDGIRFFNIPGSRTNEILNLPSTSNVALAGQWMFRTDEASVEAGGCESRGTVVCLLLHILFKSGRADNLDSFVVRRHVKISLYPGGGGWGLVTYTCFRT